MWRVTLTGWSCGAVSVPGIMSGKIYAARTRRNPPQSLWFLGPLSLISAYHLILRPRYETIKTTEGLAAEDKEQIATNLWDEPAGGGGKVGSEPPDISGLGTGTVHAERHCTAGSAGKD